LAKSVKPNTARLGVVLDVLSVLGLEFSAELHSDDSDQSGASP